MKCLSLQQPFASLILLGVKRYETRSWQTDHRGLLGIHASREFRETARALCAQEPYRHWLRIAGLNYSSDLPRGALLGTVELIDCLPAEEVQPRLDEDELALGNFTAGRWAWLVAHPRLFPHPIPLAGRLGVFEVELPR